MKKTSIINDSKDLRRLKHMPKVVSWCNVLLVIFFVMFIADTPVLCCFRSIGVDLPKAVNDHWEPKDGVTVKIDSKGSVWVGNCKIHNDKELKENLEDEIEFYNSYRGGKEKVLLKADKNARFETVLRVLRPIKKIGVKEVGLITNEAAALVHFIKTEK